MRSLFVVVVVLGLAACGDSHHIEAYWSIAKYAPPVDEVIPCPAGWDTVRVVAADPTHPESIDIESFPCTDGQAVTNYLPADYYNVHFEIWDGTKVLAQSPPVYMDVLGLNPEASARIYVDAGFIDVDWTPCASDPSGTSAFLTVTPTVPNPDFSEDDTFISCTAGQLSAGPYRDGTYSVVFGLGADRHPFASLAVTGSDVTHLGRF
jgi:hypothetical protein